MSSILNHAGSESGITPIGASSRRLEPKLPANEIRRRMWHMLPGLIPFLLAGLPRAEVEQNLWFYQTIIALAAVMLSAIAFVAYPIIARDGEQHAAINAMTYGVAALCTLLAFPREPQFAAVALIVLAFGDGSATLFGRLWGRRKLPWNSHKSWVGMTAFILCASPAASFAYWLHSIPPVSVLTAACCGGIPSIVSAGIESLSSDCCENIRVSGTAAVVVLICSSVITGYPLW